MRMPYPVSAFLPFPVHTIPRIDCVGDLVRLADPPHGHEGGVAVRVAARSRC